MPKQGTMTDDTLNLLLLWNLASLLGPVGNCQFKLNVVRHIVGHDLWYAVLGDRTADS